MATSRSDRGVIVVLVAVATVALLSLTALVIDLGIAYAAKRQLDGIAELAARAAVVRFNELQSTNFAQREATARQRAQEIVQSNRVIGLGNSALGTLGPITNPGSSGTVEFGQFLPLPNPCTAPGCSPIGPCGNLPCFQPTPVGGGIVNAARVKLWTESNRPIATLFAQVFGATGMASQSEKIVAMAPRCAVFLVDLSNSMTIENYRPLAIDPVAPGFGGAFSYYAFSEDAVNKGAALLAALEDQGLTPQTMTFGEISNFFLASADPMVRMQDAASLAWFSLLTHRPSRPLGAASPANEHFANDYVATPVKFGGTSRTYYIDAYRDATHTGPEPYRTIMEVLHNLIKYLRTTTLATDYVQIAGFDYDIRGTALVNRERFALLQQITNLDNGPRRTASGPIPEIHPNFTDFGLLPREDAPTNIFEPLYVAIENLTDPAQCPANAEKHIFIISDFLFNSVPEGTSGGLQAAPYFFTKPFTLESNGQRTFFSDTYPGYEFMREWILPGDRPGHVALHPVGLRTNRPPFTGPPATLPEFLASTGGGIRVHSVIIGDHVGPHLRNQQDPTWQSYASSGRYKFHDFLSGSAAFPNFFLVYTSLSAQYNRIFNGTYGSPYSGAAYQPFMTPNRTAYWFAIRSNGMFCPIRPPPPPGECVPDPFDPSRQIHDEGLRQHNTPQFFSTDCTNKSEQFTRCVEETFIRGVPVFPVAEYNKP